jgi:hypothetical protein
MKKILLTTAIALVGVAAFTTAKATPISYTDGDIFLAFESTSLNLDYLVDLGSGSTFASALSGGSFSSINLSADLVSVFGTGWSTNSAANVQWGLFGLPTDKSIIYASVPSGNASLVEKGVGALATTSTHFQTLATGYGNDISNHQGLTVGVEQFVNTSPDTGFATFTGNLVTAPYFSVYNVSLVNGVAGNLDIYGTTGSTSALEGTLSLSSSGLVSAVPEPSTYVLFGLGALVLILARRRKSQTSNS